MERRNSERIPINLKATISSEGNSFEGIVENMSEDGLEYFMTSIVKVPQDFVPKKLMNISFQDRSGEMFSLICELIWFLETHKEGKNLLLGMKIIDPPFTYKEMVKGLN